MFSDLHYFSWLSQEALRDLNEELEENHVQAERDLREELEMNNNKLREVQIKTLYDIVIIFFLTLICNNKIVIPVVL